eukprot:317766-Amphidinium_carterae.1
MGARSIAPVPSRISGLGPPDGPLHSESHLRHEMSYSPSTKYDPTVELLQNPIPLRPELKSGSQL